MFFNWFDGPPARSRDTKYRTVINSYSGFPSTSEPGVLSCYLLRTIFLTAQILVHSEIKAKRQVKRASVK
jgi:hypothetical protein